MQNLLTFYPGGATTAQIAAATAGKPQTTPVPAVVSYIYARKNSNWVSLYVQGIDASFDYTYRTETMGDFVTGLSLTHFLKFDHRFGDAPIYDILNTSGHSGSYPSIATQARVRAGWKTGAMSATLYANIIPGYRNWSGTTITPISSNADGNPGGGGDKVKSSVTFDATVNYTFAQEGFMKGTDLSVSVRNIFDKDPPFYNSAIGYDEFSGNPVGRRITASVTKKFF
jgi:iron complex outermembrane receptor protein